MSLLDQLSDAGSWERFYSYKQSLACEKSMLKELRAFIDRQGYRSVCECIERGARFPLPQKAVISKFHAQKKRTVYTYPPDENMVLKLLTFLLLRAYDGVFADSLYSFRPGRTAKDAVKKLLHTPGIREMHAYKADVSDYFNSVPVPMLLPQLERVTKDDPRLFRFLRSLLEEAQVLDAGRVVTEQKGIMAGTPLSSFYANLYLSELDRRFAAAGIPYCRYSDDIILFSETPEKLEAHAAEVRDYLESRGLRLNPDKECRSGPDEGWTFLGFHCRGGTVDIAPASVQKLKQKMKRKTRALQRWQKRNGRTGEQAAKAFIRAFNRKLFENEGDNELTWSLWFFPVINTAESLRRIDAYAIDCVRYLISGTRTKKRFNVRYEDVKALGFRSLLHEYYQFKAEAKEA